MNYCGEMVRARRARGGGALNAISGDKHRRASGMVALATDIAIKYQRNQGRQSSSWQLSEGACHAAQLLGVYIKAKASARRVKAVAGRIWRNLGSTLRSEANVDAERMRMRKRRCARSAI